MMLAFVGGFMLGVMFGVGAVALLGANGRK